MPKNAEEKPQPRVICFCRFVTDVQIRKAIAEGAHTLPAIRKATSANTGCGGCEEKILAIIAETLPSRKKKA